MQEVELYLSIYCLSNPTTWDESVGPLEFAYNSHPHGQNRKSPFELLMGYLPARVSESHSSTFPSTQERLARLEEWRKDAAAAHELARQIMKDRHNKPLQEFHEGQLVWLSSRNLNLRDLNSKIQPKRQGPFKIIKKMGPVTYKLELPKTWKQLHPVFYAGLLKPFHRTEQYGDTHPMPPPELVEGQEEYEVDHIRKRRRNKNGTYSYLIHWKGYGDDEDSWEPERNLTGATEMVAEFNRRRKK